MLKKFKLLYHTIKHLKATQILHQLKYRIKKPGTLANYSKTYAPESICFLNFKELPPVYTAYLGNNTFAFLNQERFFDGPIDWSCQENGKLWNYNLQYANYLLQQDISFDDKAALMESMFNWLNSGKLPLEPYPVSLRSINVLRWFSSEGKLVNPIVENVHAELDFLSKRPEYHLLGNHLLENAFALMMGGAFFSDLRWIKQGQKILRNELQEQIMTDGAHFELSPMYHQIILFRLLELIDWYSKWSSKENTFESYLVEKAGLMLTWLKNISFENGDIPHFNDSTDGIAYSTNWLINYADKLGIPISNIPLGESGYRSIKINSYEFKIDFAQLGPSYQPGHAHADALSFICYSNNQPLFVEFGTSTYETGNTRNLERATTSHNSIVLNNESQSQVYSGFRVGKRAITKIIKDNDFELAASHDGYYSTHKIIHQRDFIFNEDDIRILDTMINSKNEIFKAYFHLSPLLGNITIERNNKVVLNDTVSIEFENAMDIDKQSYNFALGFNKTKAGTVLSVSFKKELRTTILFNY